MATTKTATQTPREIDPITTVTAAMILKKDTSTVRRYFRSKIIKTARRAGLSKESEWICDRGEVVALRQRMVEMVGY